MTERRTARRYDLTLPIIIRVPPERRNVSKKGTTRDISTCGLYFVIEQDLEVGSDLDITLTLPAELTRGRKYRCAPKWRAWSGATKKVL